MAELQHLFNTHVANKVKKYKKMIFLLYMTAVSFLFR